MSLASVSMVVSGRLASSRWNRTGSFGRPVRAQRFPRRTRPGPLGSALATAFQRSTGGRQEKVNLRKGQKVFIQAGSGGVGTFAIQLAKHLGATVATTTGTSNVAMVKSLGADVVIDYKTQDVEPDPEFGEEIRAPWFVQLIMRLLSAGTRRQAKSRGIGFSQAAPRQGRRPDQMIRRTLCRHQTCGRSLAMGAPGSDSVRRSDAITELRQERDGDREPTPPLAPVTRTSWREGARPPCSSARTDRIAV